MVHLRLQQAFGMQPDRTESTRNAPRWQIVSLHILCWLAFLSLPALFNERIDELTPLEILKDITIAPRMANGAFFIALFYYSYYVTIPAYYFSRQFATLAMYMATTMAIFFVLNYAMMPGRLGWHHHHHARAADLLGPSYNLFMYIIVCVVCFAMCLYNKWQKVHKEKLSTEISFLKAQINPHFLFNTLNSIYALTLTRSDYAPEAVLKLSGMMRYATSDSTREYVSLEKELEYITDYIDLQKLRLDKNVIFEYNVTGNTSDKRITPFVLIPFIENAFKYGVNTEETSRIVVNINVTDQHLEMKVNNRKVTVQPAAASGTGMGISNTRMRLQLLYPGKHQLEVKNGKEDFDVLLKLEWQ